MNENIKDRGFIDSSVSRFKSGADKFLPPNLQEAFEKAVLGGQKLLYSEPMKDMVDEALAGEGQIEKKLAEGVAGLMGVVITRSKPMMPPEIIIPVAIELLHDAVDALSRSGKIQALSQEQLKFTTQSMIVLLATKLGAKPDQIRSMMSGQMQQPQQPAQQPPQQPQMPPSGMEPPV